MKLILQRTLWLLVSAAMLCGGTKTLADDGEPVAQDITGQCTFTMAEDAAAGQSRLTDGRAASYINFAAKSSLKIMFSEQAQGICLEWDELPKGITVTLLDRDENIIDSTEYQPQFLNEYYPFGVENAAGVEIGFVRASKLSTVAIYGAGELPESVQRWEPTLTAPTVLIVAAYPGDELLCFSGLVPTLTAEGVPFAIAYMSQYGRARQAEALNALWSLGVRNYPFFIGAKDSRNQDADYLSAAWKKSGADTLLLKALQQLQPSVVVTHAAEGEYGLAATQATAAFVSAAVKTNMAKDGTVQKLYLHEAGENATTVNYTDAAWCYAQSNAILASANAYQMFSSQLVYHRTVSDSATYHLVASAVGEDTGSDLTEHIAFTALAVPTPVPTATPEPTPTPAPTEVPGQTAALTEEDPAFEQSTGQTAGSGSLLLYAAIIGIGVLLTVAAFLLVRKCTSQKTRRIAIIASLLPLAAGVVIAALLYINNHKAAVEPSIPLPGEAPAITQLPNTTSEQSEPPLESEQTESLPASAEGTPSVPAATPHPWAEYFRSAEDEAEVVVFDMEKGHWEYRTDTLSVLIDRTETKTDLGPLVYFTAHVRMIEEDSFRVGFGSEGRTGRTSLIPWRVARRYKAVLAFTGDNIINMDVGYKGVIIRDGRLYNSGRKESSMAWYSDSMTMRIFSEKEATPAALLAEGIENAFSFGPPLIVDGEINEAAVKSRISKENPRCGIGMIEPGHFVVIVVDGRQTDYSVGLEILDFAAMFEKEGCKQAYNLDGGVSACMLFMGEQLNMHGDIEDFSKQRRVPDLLIFGYSELVPTEEDPITYAGLRKTDAEQ